MSPAAHYLERNGILIRVRVRVCRPGQFRALATAAAEASSSSSAPPPVASGSTDPTLNRIVDDISGLSLLQAADLVTLLKVCLRCWIRRMWNDADGIVVGFLDATKYPGNRDADWTRACSSSGSRRGSSGSRG